GLAGALGTIAIRPIPLPALAVTVWPLLAIEDGRTLFARRLIRSLFGFARSVILCGSFLRRSFLCGNFLRRSFLCRSLLGSGFFGRSLLSRSFLGRGRISRFIGSRFLGRS